MLVYHYHHVVVVEAIGIIDSPELGKHKYVSINSIDPVSEKRDVKSLNEFSTNKITHNDVVRSSNSVYTSQSQSSNSGIIFAVTGHSLTAPLMPTGLC